MWSTIIKLVILGGGALVLLRLQKFFYIPIKTFKWVVFFVVALGFLIVMAQFAQPF